MYFAYIFGGLFSAIATVVATFFSKMIVDCFTNNSQIDNLIKIVVILTVVVVVSFAFNLFFKAVIEADALMMRNNQFIICANLYNDVDYQKIENPTFQNRSKKRFNSYHLMISILAKYFRTIRPLC